MRPLGLLLIALTLALPAFGFAQLAAQHDPVALFSQYLGSAALIVMAISQILATRVWGLETIFGGMDRIYVLHKWLGIGAMALIVLHDTIDAEMDGLGRETAVTEIAETLGEFSLYGLLVLVTLSIATFVPYHLWKYTHKAMGAFFTAGALHYAFILKPFPINEPLGLYILAFCGLGVLAYVYTLLPTGLFNGWRRYRVISVEPTGGAIAVSLEPVGRGFRHQAGQFAFVRFEVPGLTEIHPFTISKAPASDRTLRFTIKDLGDYTRDLAHTLHPGAEASVSGPFGHFRLHRKPGLQVWIASGVGITPFMAWAEALDTGSGPVHLFYSVRRRDAAPHLAELETLASAKPNLRLHLVETSTQGRLTMAQVAAIVGDDRRQARVSFCGPREMREALRQQLASAGFATNSFHYEEFEIRGGIGLRKLSTWLAGRMSSRQGTAASDAST